MTEQRQNNLQADPLLRNEDGGDMKYSGILSFVALISIFFQSGVYFLGLFFSNIVAALFCSSFYIFILVNASLIAYVLAHPD